MRLEDCLHFRMASAQKREEALYRELLTPYDVTPSQAGVLAAMDWQAANPKRIAERLRLEGSTVSGILDRMEKKELLVRSVNPDNRREVLVSPTQKALDLREDMDRVAEELEKRLLGQYPKGQAVVFQKILMDLLERM